MSEENSYSRKACLEDFLCDADTEQKHEKQHKTYHDEKIQKIQREYGQRKRIKP
jgi:hypothetical protein